jgi:hypothetical protein
MATARGAMERPHRPSKKSAETPERRGAPPRCSDVSFIVKHSLCAVDPETALHGKPFAPTQGGWSREIPQFHATDDEASA